MKKILLQVSSPGLANNAIFREGDINNSNSRWRELKSKLATMGYELKTADNNKIDDCEGVIFHDATSLGLPLSLFERAKRSVKKILGIHIAPQFPTRKIYDEMVSVGKKDKTVLLIWEGKTICPLNFKEYIWDKFGHVITWDDDLLSDPKFIKYYMPIEPPRKEYKKIPFSEKKLLVNISFNKISKLKNELYSERRKSIDYFDYHHSKDFDLFGLSWGEPARSIEVIFPSLIKKYTSYRGSTKDKLETLSKYKFSICYENNSGQKGYISEKIFDNFHVGTVPIYWGATNVEEHVDPDAFIDRRKFKNNEELAKFISKITEEEYNEYLVAAKNYLKSDKYAKFKPEYFCDQVIKALNLK